MRRFVPTFLLVPLLAGCELTSVVIADVSDVAVAEVYLRAGEPSHIALVYRTFPGEPEPIGIPGATVVVRDESGGELAFTPRLSEAECVADFAGVRCYVATDPDGFVRPGAAYALEIVLPDGRRLEGRTTVPGDFRILAPGAEECALDTTALDVVWSRSDGAWAYQIDAVFRGLAAGLAERGVESPPDSLRLLGLAISAEDTTIAFPAEFGVFDRFELDRDLLLALAQGLPDGARADIVVAAGDRNFANWVRGGNFNPSGQVRVPSITGDGTGAFASLVQRRRVLLADTTAGLPRCR